MVAAQHYDLPRLLEEWRWLVPFDHQALFVSVLADWVFRGADGSVWVLSALEGTYRKIAENAQQYNELQQSERWVAATFLAGWQQVAADCGLLPTESQCLGWKVHPLVGGTVMPTNLQVFDMASYQCRMGQLHRQLQCTPTQQAPKKRPWFKFWQRLVN